MSAKKSIIPIQSRAPETMEPAIVAGFSLSKYFRDKMGTHKKYLLYKPAKVYDGAKCFVYFSYLNPQGKFQRFKVYPAEVDRADKKQFLNELKDLINKELADGFNPFEAKLNLLGVKTWTLIQALNYFKQKIPDLGLRLKTTQGYYSFLDQFTKVFAPVGNKPLDEITRMYALNALTKLKKDRKWGNTMYNNALTFGRLMFSYFNQNGICAHNPFKEIKPLQETKTQNQPFSNEDWKTIIDEADPDLKLFMLFLYHTGTRPNEARQLEYDHILRQRKLLYIPGKLSKGKKDGYVPLSDQFLELFPKGTGLIFGTSKNYYTLKFTALKRKLELNDKYTLYSTKHTRAVHLAEDGASPYAIMQLFRHSSLEITMSYLRNLGLNIGREAADKVR